MLPCTVDPSNGAKSAFQTTFTKIAHELMFLFSGRPTVATGAFPRHTKDSKRLTTNTGDVTMSFSPTY